MSCTFLGRTTREDVIAFRRLCWAHTRLIRTISSSPPRPHRSDPAIRRRNRGSRLSSQQACRDGTKQDSPGSGQNHSREGYDNVIDVLEQRGLLNQLAGDRLRLQKLVSQGGKSVGVYCGVDATAKSLHVGHMVPFMALFWMCLHGHPAISLIGGATCRIGDPTGRLTSRDTLEDDRATANIQSITDQLHRLWLNVGKLADRHGLLPHNADPALLNKRVLNNEAWAEVGFLTLLRKLGTGFRLGSMLAKDTVRNKMEKGDGMSFAEFSYPLMQAWDWWHMYSSEDNVRIQIGGSDQYGNITAGIDAINHMRQAERQMDQDRDVFGFTVPLLKTASGEKFGKSAGNAVWLDRELMDPFKLYQYFVSTPDADVEKLLMFFTFIPMPKIAQIMARHEEDPGKRHAQHTLAVEFVSLAHGPEEALQIQARQTAVFSKGSSVEEFISGAPHVDLAASQVWGQSIPRVLHNVGLVNSKGAAARTILGGGVYMGRNVDGQLEWVAIPAEKPSVLRAIERLDAVASADGGTNSTLLLRVGKTNVRAVRVVEE